MPIRTQVFGVMLALCGVLVATPALAMLVQPVVIDLQTTGEHSNAAITVVNDRNRPDTVEVTVSRMTLPEKGAPVLTPDKGDNFLIFPPIATIPPGKTQVIRIRWVGAPDLTESQTYMFSTTELPVDQPKGSGVQIVYSIQSVVTVTPPALKPDVHAVGVVRDTETPSSTLDHPAKPVRGISVTFRNDGNAIDYVSHYKVTFSIGGSSGWSKTFEAPDVSHSVGLGLLAPNSKRILFFPMADVPESGDITASLEEAPSR